MTREKTIRKILDTVLWTRNASDVCKNNLTDAIVEALEQEPITKNDLAVDCISRQAVNGYIDYILSHGMGKKKSFDFIKKFVTKLPSVTPQEPCEDCISRKSVEELISNNNDKYGYSDRFHEFTEECMKLPPVQPKQEPCNDCISREKALGLADWYIDKIREVLEDGNDES